VGSQGAAVTRRPGPDSRSDDGKPGTPLVLTLLAGSRYSWRSIALNLIERLPFAGTVMCQIRLPFFAVMGSLNFSNANSSLSLGKTASYVIGKGFAFDAVRDTARQCLHASDVTLPSHTQ
jgi:hypothetical protein